MRVVSLFDGISCARVALDRAGIVVESYLASELDPKAISIAQKNYPQTVQLGDVRGVHIPDGQVELLIGGSPCTDLSIAKAGRQGLAGQHSSLFWEYARVLRETNPRWFILENVASMSKKDRDIITQELGVEPVLFDAALVSAQTRKRLFWTNIKFDLPPDRGIMLKDILQPENEVDESMTVDSKSFCFANRRTNVEHTGAAIRGRQNEDGVWVNTLQVREDGKANALTQSFSGKLSLVKHEQSIRKLTPIECERLQGLPDNYTEGIAKTHRYKCLGNAFNVDVVAHILSHLPH